MTRQAQTLGTEGVQIFIPLCQQNGDFEDIQCDNYAGRCWCVDKQGLEKPGTRASSRNLVSCTAPRKCASMLCRMLCPYNFELDERGCPICQCRNPCKGIKCPGNQECQVEEIPCSGSVCPPLPTCKRARSLDTLCSTGRPLSATGSRPFLCGMEPNKPQCPPGFLCDVENGNEYGVCCPLKDKPGKCPKDIRMAKCGPKCSIDTECEGDKKCCEVDGCEKMCLTAQNTSLCIQQAETAALIGMTKNSKTYIPQCTKDGEFEPKQCLDNLCWCVDNKGLQISGTFGMKEVVICKKEEEKAFLKPGICPSDENSGCSGSPCTSDLQCEGKQKCCESSECGFRCVLPKSEARLPTTCEHLRRVGEKLLLHNKSLAIPVPQCLSDGTFKPVQCDSEDKCWCVNTFGVKIGEVASKQELSCREGRAWSCDGHICRLGCTYGFEIDKNGCEICECRDPCKDAECPSNQICQMVQVDCDYDWCPSIPQCVPLPENICLHGSPLFNDVKKTPVVCSAEFIESKESACPETHTCIEFQPLYGVCCPTSEPVVDVAKAITAVKIGSCPKVQPWEVGICINQCESDSDCNGFQKCCLNGCDKYVCRDPEGFLGKEGQCPYNLSNQERTCDFKCRSDYQCRADEKCCSNGCGMECMAPLKNTACQHQRIASEMRMKQLDLTPEDIYVPSCRLDGGFEEIQCDPVSKTCWCVDDKGIKRTGTTTTYMSREEMNCTSNHKCPSTECSLNCPGGLQHSKEGCPICACLDPCEHLECTNPSEECRSVNVKCISEPCPPLTLCLPKLQNPCPVGKPLQKSLGSLFTCGLSGNKCPSSHRCHLSPFDEYSVCCPKTRADCFAESSYGTCSEPREKWYFNKNTSSCEKFSYSGCGGNLNNFESKEHCEATCPVVTSCRTVHEEALSTEKQGDKVVFVPKCNKITGEWESIQCLESLGICWCVNNKGQKIPGTAVRGTPICHKRKGRRLDDDPICSFGEPAYKCPDDLCKYKMCFSHPKATCRINPCGGCHIEFYDENNRRVNCNQGLTACHSEVQEILNSPAWVHQGIPYKDVAHMLPKEFRMASTQFSEIINAESQESLQKKPFIQEHPPQRSPISHVTLDIGLGGSKITFHTADGKYRRRMKRSPDARRSRFTSSLKGGECPNIEVHSMFKGLLGGCGKSCSADADCTGFEKCCLTGCGLTCEKPIFYGDQTVVAHPTIKSMNVMPPACSSEGGYSVVQKQGDLSWCVSKFGNPIHATLTRGEVKCNTDGSIKERKEYAPVCPYSDRPPKVCKNECLHAYCHQHPTAACKADPCDDCSVSFYNEKGEKVNCIDKCLQPLERGNCGESHTRYHFNSIAGRCEKFTYSGCNKNDNHFMTSQECEQACNHPVPVCEQPLEPGTCRAFTPRWFYNKFTHRCEKFHYGGCGGNNNNFETRELCEARCPDLVLCPWSSAGVSIKSCSRYKSCVNKKCPANPKAICTVDPCSCESYFVDSFGKFVACDYMSRGPLQLIASPMTRETRCQNVRRKHLSSGAAYVAQCTEDGRFASKQCAHTPRGTTECWCVDELGKQLPNSASFIEDHGSCEQVKIDHVDVMLAFKHNSSQYSEGRRNLIKNAIERYLRNISANIGEVQLNILPNNTVVAFTLTGENKDQVAYQLERMVKNGGMALHSQSAVLPVDVRSSHFHHMNEAPPKNFIEIKQPESIHSSEGGSSAVMALVIVAVVGIILVLLIIITLVHKRRQMGFAPEMQNRFQKSKDTICQFLTGRCALQDRRENSPVTTCKRRPSLIDSSSDISEARTITAESRHGEFYEIRGSP